jgi:hypothetical protein
MHETPKHCMQVAGLWKVPKILSSYAFSDAFDDGSNPAMAVMIRCRSELAPGGDPTMNSRALRFVSNHAASLTTIASKLAPTLQYYF